MRPIDELIAERRLQLLDRNGATEVLVQLGRPRADDGGLWLCDVRVASIVRVIERTAAGGDGFDALRVALQMIRQELVDDLPRASGGTVRMDPAHADGAVSAEELFPNQFPSA